MTLTLTSAPPAQPPAAALRRAARRLRRRVFTFSPFFFFFFIVKTPKKCPFLDAPMWGHIEPYAQSVATNLVYHDRTTGI